MRTPADIILSLRRKFRASKMKILAAKYGLQYTDNENGVPKRYNILSGQAGANKILIYDLYNSEFQYPLWKRVVKHVGGIWSSETKIFVNGKPHEVHFRDLLKGLLTLGDPYYLARVSELDKLLNSLNK